MTRVTLRREGERCTLICRGHAAGSPALCAAVSCLVYTAAGWARNRAAVLRERMRDGEAELIFSGPEAGTVYDLLRIGFLQLERGDPARLRVTERRISAPGDLL